MRQRLHGIAAQCSREQRIRKILITDRPQKSLDRQRADGCAAPVGGRREWTAMDHRVRDFDAGRPAVGNQPAGFALDDGQQRAANASSVW
jgi:hypothetical protein